MSSTTLAEPADRSTYQRPRNSLSRPAHAEPDNRKQLTAELIARAAASDGEERQELLDRVIVLNIPVAHALASRYRNRGQPLDELEQVACLALTKAVRAYDPA